MNSAQLTSLVKQLLNAAGGYLAVHGAVASASILNAQDTAGLVTLLLVWIYSHFIQHTDEAEATPTPLPASKGGGTLLPVAIAVLLVSLVALGCANQNKRLELGGAYAPAMTALVTNSTGVVSTNLVATQQADFALYATDVAFNLAYSSIDAAFTIERNNREYLWKVSPTIKHTLDSIRPQARQAVIDYANARSAYELSPTPANATALQTVISKLQALTSAATAATASVTITNK